MIAAAAAARLTLPELARMMRDLHDEGFVDRGYVLVTNPGERLELEAAE